MPCTVKQYAKCFAAGLRLVGHGFVLFKFCTSLRLNVPTESEGIRTSPDIAFFCPKWWPFRWIEGW